MRSTLITLTVVIVLGFVGLYTTGDALKRKTETHLLVPNPAARPSSLDGVYEFVSQTTDVTFPTERTERVSAPEWYGLWVFNEGYFSETRMKNLRADWTPSYFPSEPQGLGFDGASGTYVLDEDAIELKYRVHFYPGRIGAIEDLKYHLDNDTLTLTWQLVPGPESQAAGRRVTVLKKIM